MPPSTAVTRHLRARAARVLPELEKSGLEGRVGGSRGRRAGRQGAVRVKRGREAGGGIIRPDPGRATARV